MARTDFNELLQAGVHFGHLKRKWNPDMAPFIFMERNGIHIIDLYKTAAKIDESAEALKKIARQGKKILFVATKKQAKAIVEEKVKPIGMPYIVERWQGGMLTNFTTLRRSIKKMKSFEKMETDGTFDKLSKRERLQIQRKKAKMQRLIGSVADMNRLPGAVFVVDVLKERIAVNEALKLHIPVFGIVDTNSDPNIDYVIPANDDATKSVSLITDIITKAVQEGIEERKAEKDKEKEAPKEKKEGQKESKGRKRQPRKTRARKEPAKKETSARKETKSAEASDSSKEQKESAEQKQSTEKEQSAEQNDKSQQSSQSENTEANNSNE